MQKKTRIENIFKIFTEENSSPKTELNYTNEFTLLVAVVLSAQATDIGVNKATNTLFRIIKKPKDILDLGEEGLKKYIKTIGLYNSKAKNIILLSKKLQDEHNNVIPDNLQDLQELPGVGRKTANVFLNCARGKPTIAVDTHVFRVSNRMGITKAKNVLESEKQLLKNIPKKYLLTAHHHLILHGRYICKARKPLCHQCNVVEFCTFKDKNVIARSLS